MPKDRIKEVLRAALLKQDGEGQGNRYAVVYDSGVDERWLVIDGSIDLDKLAEDVLFALSL